MKMYRVAYTWLRHMADGAKDKKNYTFDSKRMKLYNKIYTQK